MGIFGSQQGGGGGTVTQQAVLDALGYTPAQNDHGTIAGLGDDDHAQYGMARPSVVAVTFSAGATTTITLDGGRTEHFTATATGASTWVIANPPAAGKSGGFILDLTNGATGGQTWSGMKFDGGTAPSLTLAGKDRLVFSWDGSVWLVALAAKDWK